MVKMTAMMKLRAGRERERQKAGVGESSGGVKLKGEGRGGRRRLCPGPRPAQPGLR